MYRLCPCYLLVMGARFQVGGWVGKADVDAQSQLLHEGLVIGVRQDHQITGIWV